MFRPVARRPKQKQPTPLAREVDWTALSPRSRATLPVCWKPLLMGYTPLEIAQSVGVSTTALYDALNQLREEIQARDGRSL
jgi:hypothetical protein